MLLYYIQNLRNSSFHVSMLSRAPKLNPTSPEFLDKIAQKAALLETQLVHQVHLHTCSNSYLHLPTHPPAHLLTHPPAHLLTYLHTHLHICLLTCTPTCLPAYTTAHLPAQCTPAGCTHLHTYLHTCTPDHLQVYEEIAGHFSETRHKPWPRVLQFLDTVQVT